MSLEAGDWGLGVGGLGGWGLGTGDWGTGGLGTWEARFPQSPAPNPQSPGTLRGIEFHDLAL